MATLEYGCSKCGGSLDNATWICTSCGEDYSDNVTEEEEEDHTTVFTGWKTVTPGKCLECGFNNDWHVDGRGNILCGCQACVDCGPLSVYGFHNFDCPFLEQEHF